jgi:spore germination protein KA
MKTEKNENTKIFSDIDKNFDFIADRFGNGIGLIKTINEISQDRTQVGLAYIDSVTDRDMIREHVLKPLLSFSGKLPKDPENSLMLIKTGIIAAADTQITKDLDQVIEKILMGFTVLFIEGAESALIIGSRKVEKKAVEVPENETTVLGSQESFTDELSTNLSLIIKRLPVQGLHIEEYVAGRLSRTTIKLVWLEGIADPKVIEEARIRIKRIDIDNVDGIGSLAEMIEDRPKSIFPKYRQTERPDMAARRLTDGHFIILCSNSPFAFIAPIVFWDNFKTMDDYQDRSSTSSYLRAIRYIAVLLSAISPSLYLAFVTYNQAIIPPTLALNIAAGREGVPLPTVIELILMSLAMSVIREAGLRMTGSVGYFIGTLAAVLIGQSIVTAGYVSSSLIIVVAAATISSFAISTTTMVYPVKILDFFFIVLAGLFGIFGIVNGLIILFWHLVSLNSFGVPYLYPVVPFDKDGFKDTFVRSSFRKLKKRTKRLAPQNRVREGENGAE